MFEAGARSACVNISAPIHTAAQIQKRQVTEIGKRSFSCVFSTDFAFLFFFWDILGKPFGNYFLFPL